MAISLGDVWDISRIRLPGQSVSAIFIQGPNTVPIMYAGLARLPVSDSDRRFERSPQYITLC